MSDDDLIRRVDALALCDKIADAIGARPMSSIHSALSEYRNGIRAIPATDAREKALREALDNKEQLDIWAQEILEGLGFSDVLKIESYDDKIEAHSVICRGIVEVLRALIGEART